MFDYQLKPPQDTIVRQIRKKRILTAAALGQPLAQIGKEIGLSRDRISRVVNLPESQEFLAEAYEGVREQLMKRLPGIVSAALDLVEKEMKSKSHYDKASRMFVAHRIVAMAINHLALPEPEPEPDTGHCDCCFCKYQRSAVINAD